MNSVTYEEYPPAPELRPWVQCYWTTEWGAATTARPHRVTPDGCVDVFFRFGAPATRPFVQPCGGYVIGAMTRPFLAMTGGGGGSRLLAVRFEPGGAYRFLRGEASELTDQQPALAEIWGEAGTRLWNELASALDDKHQQLALLDRALRHQFAFGSTMTTPPPAAWLGRAVAALRDQAGQFRIADLCAHLGLSRQHIARVFSQQIGLSPKQLARIFRLRRLLRRARARNEVDWADLAVEFGFYDQAHLIGECQRLNGLTPVQCLAPTPEKNDG